MKKVRETKHAQLNVAVGRSTYKNQKYIRKFSPENKHQKNHPTYAKKWKKIFKTTQSNHQLNSQALAKNMNRAIKRQKMDNDRRSHFNQPIKNKRPVQNRKTLGLNDKNTWIEEATAKAAEISQKVATRLIQSLKEDYDRKLEEISAKNDVKMQGFMDETKKALLG